MRLIGNKTRLLGEIEGFLRDRGVQQGTLIDAFAGTSSVGRHFKERGFRVIANDRLAPCYVKAVAGIEVSSCPSFEGLRARHRAVLGSAEFLSTFEYTPRPLSPRGERLFAEAVHLFATAAPPVTGLITRSFTPDGPAGRCYFTPENGRRIDGCLELLRAGHLEGFLTDGELYLLLSALLDAADRVANISGTYGAYLKTWQRNALQPLQLEVPEVIPSSKANRAYRCDANDLVRKVKGDVLYVDPPYNERQYAANYHVLQIIAEYHEVKDLAEYEAGFYGKTGLRPYGELLSDYCNSRGKRRASRDVFEAMRDLVLSASVDHVLVSYNEEGLLSREDLGHILATFAGKRTFDFDTDMRSILYKRFRSDSDRPEGGARGRRSYKVLEGKRRNEISEWLFYARRARGKSRRGRRTVGSTVELAGGS